MKKVQIITMTITFWLESSSSRMSQESGLTGRYSVLCMIHSVRLPISWNYTYNSFTFNVALICCKQTCSWESLIRRTRSEQWIIRPICCVLWENWQYEQKSVRSAEWGSRLSQVHSGESKVCGRSQCSVLCCLLQWRKCSSTNFGLKRIRFALLESFY